MAGRRHLQNLHGVRLLQLQRPQRPFEQAFLLKVGRECLHLLVSVSLPYVTATRHLNGGVYGVYLVLTTHERPRRQSRSTFFFLLLTVITFKQAVTKAKKSQINIDLLQTITHPYACESKTSNVSNR